MNIAELSTIGGTADFSFGNIIAVSGLIHSLGPGICIITLGRNGAVLSVEKGRTVYHIPPIALSNEIDPTGCGDTFAAVFLYNFLASGNPLASAKMANRYAAAKVTFAGLDGFQNINGILDGVGPGIDPVKIK